MAREGWTELQRDKKQKEFFEVLSVSRADLRQQFRKNPEALKRIRTMTDDEMKHLAGKFGDALMNTYWDTLEIVFEEKFLKRG